MFVVVFMYFTTILIFIVIFDLLTSSNYHLVIIASTTMRSSSCLFQDHLLTLDVLYGLNFILTTFLLLLLMFEHVFLNQLLIKGELIWVLLILLLDVLE